MRETFKGLFQDKTVLLTGHTGFKGSWLAIWLRELGAHVVGYSLEAPTQPNNFTVTGLENRITHRYGDIGDKEALNQVIQEYRPEVIFHLAAQAIVLHSYESPLETFEVNAQGTVNLMEAARHCPSVKAMVMVTTDKCYENRGWIWGYREQDPLGGSDPYSASKAMAELAIQSYRRSFFAVGKPSIAMASARAGNVIGGGDFSDFRIVPDTLKALMAGQPVLVRNPRSVRPWLNVLDPLSGYLWLAAGLLEKGQEYAEAWNFGPLEHRGVPVQDLVEKAIQLWGHGGWVDGSTQQLKPEMGMLRLDWDKAANQLQWQPTYNWEEALSETVSWFKEYGRESDMYEVCVDHIQAYTYRAQEQNIEWAKEEVCASLKHP